MGRLVKIKEKVLHPGNDLSHEVDFSSMTNGTTMMKNSMTTLTIEADEDSDEEEKDHRLSNKHRVHDYHKEVEYNREDNQNQPKGMVKNYSSEVVYDSYAASQKQDTSSLPNNNKNPKNTSDSMSTTRPLNNMNMALSDQLKAVIEENKAKYKDYENYMNTNTEQINKKEPEPQMVDPNKNMINLENILLIEEKLKQI